MKRLLTLGSIIIVFLLFPIVSFASNGHYYSFDEQGFSIGLPSDMSFFITKDNLADNPGSLIPEYEEAMENGYILFVALNDACTVEIDAFYSSFEELTADDTEEDLKVINLNQFSDDDLNNYLEEIKEGYEYPMVDPELHIYRTGDAVFTVNKFYSDTGEGLWNKVDYATTYNGDYYLFKMYPVDDLDRDLTEDDYEYLESILDTIKFTATDRQLMNIQAVEESQNLGSSYDILFTIIAAVLAIGCGVLCLITIIRKPKKEKINNPTMVVSNNLQNDGYGQRNFCRTCGAPLPEGSSFCSQCGERVL